MTDDDLPVIEALVRKEEDITSKIKDELDALSDARGNR
jgi:hypothetical protein